MSTELRKQVAEITDLAMRVNLETQFAAFSYITGHVDWIELKIAEDKTHNFGKTLFQKRLGYSCYSTLNQTDFKSIINALNVCLNHDNFYNVYTAKIEVNFTVLKKNFISKEERLAWIENIKGQLKQEPEKITLSEERILGEINFN